MFSSNNVPPSETFFQSLESLIRENGIKIDRPKGFSHPRFPDLVYHINYGYIEGTTSQDGQGIDVYYGDDPTLGVVGVICTVDMFKKDSEVKVLYGCTDDNTSIALKMSNNGPMCGILIKRMR